MRELTIFHSNGTQQTAGASLVAGDYYAEFTTQGSVSSISSMQWVWDATAAVTVTMEDSNIKEATTYVAAAGVWDPVSVTVPTIAGGSAGTDVISYVDWAAGRRRTKLAVGTAGVVRVYENHKP